MQMLEIHVETDETVQIGGEIKTVKPFIFISANELLEIVKARSRNYDEGEWESTGKLNLLEAKIVWRADS